MERIIINGVKKSKWWKVVLIVLAILSFWTFIVCFPNPFVFIRNGMRYLRPPIDPSVVELIETEVPEEAEEIEKLVKVLVRYEYDWRNYSVPDYVSTPREAVARRSGDCEDRAVVLASLLEAKNIPYSLKASPVHYWVHYPGKRTSRLENENVALFRKEDGKYKLKLPDLSQWQRYLTGGKKGLWDMMPTSRKAMMVSGWVLIMFSGYVLGRKREELAKGKLAVTD